MAYHSDEIPIDVVLSCNGLLPMHCAYSNSDIKKLSFPDPKPKCRFSKTMHFSVTSLTLQR